MRIKRTSFVGQKPKQGQDDSSQSNKKPPKPFAEVLAEELIKGLENNEDPNAKCARGFV